ncbi:hypothetical protein [Citreicoccus inhibens]|nr:hypothetical protein [Citreicoccus inhibens]
MKAQALAAAAFMADKHVNVFTDETVTTTGWGSTVYAMDVLP